MARKPAKKAETRKESGSTGARPIWSGAISFGLVNIPINLYSMEKRADVHFKMIDSRNHAAIRYERVNEETGEEVPWDQIVKGYEYTKGNYVIMQEEDFAKVSVEASQIIEIESFVKEEEIEDLLFDKPYIVAPGKRAEKGYVLLREIMKKTGKVGIARVVIRTREYLAAVMPKDDAIVVVLMRYAQELRKTSDFNLPEADFEISEREIKLGEQLVTSMTTKFKPETYKDEYREKLMAYIEELAEKGTVKRTEGDEKPSAHTGKVIDLADLLAKSIPKKDAKAG